MRLHSRRVVTTGLCLLLPVLGAIEALSPWSERALPCWFSSDARVGLVASMDPACPLKRGDRVEGSEAGGRTWIVLSRTDLQELLVPGQESVPVTVRSSQGSRRVDLPLQGTRRASPASISAAALVAIFLLGLALATLWTSASAAAMPLALFTGTVATGLVAAAARPVVGTLDSVWIASHSILPATVLHTALEAPTRSGLLIRMRGLSPLLYAAAALSALGGILSVSRVGPVVGIVDLGYSAMTAVAAFAVGLSSLSSVSRGVTARSRVHAAALLFSVAGLAACLIWLGTGAEANGSQDLPPLFLAVVGTLFVLAAFQHTIPDAPRSVRWIGSNAIFLLALGSASGLLLFMAHRAGWWSLLEGQPGAVLFAGFLIVVSLEAVRVFFGLHAGAWLLPGMRAREASWLRFLEEASAGKDLRAVGGALLGAIREGIPCVGASLFVPVAGNGWRIEETCGRGPTNPRLAALAIKLSPMARGGLIATYDALAIQEETAQDLLEQGVDAVGLVGDKTHPTGLVLIGSLDARAVLTADQVQFLSSVLATAGAAMKARVLEEDLASAERVAAASHATRFLLHDLGRPIGEILVEAQQALRDSSSDEPTNVSFRSILGAAEDCLDYLERASKLDEAGRDTPAATRLSLIISGAVERVAKTAGRRPVLRLPPEDPLLPAGRDVQRALENLLENAYLCDPGSNASVQVYASVRGTRTVLQVIDDGPGMTALELSRCNEPFVSGRGSSGLGLAITQQIATSLGGTMAIDSSPTSGTRVELNLPLVEHPCAR